MRKRRISRSVELDAAAEAVRAVSLSRQENPYNIIVFQSDVYTESAKLEVTPAPDTIIRVFMAWQAADEYVELEPQGLTAPEREGFTVIEWGGTEVK